MVYSICNRPSFEWIRSLYDNIRRLKVPVASENPTSTLTSSKLPLIILIGNKVDMGHGRKVSAAEGKQLAEELQCGFEETTAKSNVEKVFNDFIRQYQSSSPCHGELHSKGEVICGPGCIIL